MVTRTNNTDCVVQLIVSINNVPLVIRLDTSVEFFTNEIMVKAIRFMPDIPPNLMEFVDTLRKVQLALTKV